MISWITYNNSKQSHFGTLFKLTVACNLPLNQFFDFRKFILKNCLVAYVSVKKIKSSYVQLPSLEIIPNIFDFVMRWFRQSGHDKSRK